MRLGLAGPMVPRQGRGDGALLGPAIGAIARYPL